MADLTTTQAPFIEDARRRGQGWITQPYALYSARNHEAWRRLMARQAARWTTHAVPTFLEGLARIQLPTDAVPVLEDINTRLAPLTGFRAVPVSGYLSAPAFFGALARRDFPTTITVRPPDQLDYLPEPDLFHDLAGHVPLHADPRFADSLVAFGQCGTRIIELTDALAPAAQLAARQSAFQALARVFWFTIEFGLMATSQGVRVYGSGLLSSYAEIEAALHDPTVHRAAARLEWLIHQGFDPHAPQPLLIIVEGFDHLYALLETLRGWLEEGRLWRVAGGEPHFTAVDVAPAAVPDPAVGLSDLVR